MKFKPKLILILCILIVFLTIYPSFIHAQDCPDIVEEDPDIACPIDGGVSALLAIGILYGVKKGYDYRKQ